MLNGWQQLQIEKMIANNSNIHPDAKIGKNVKIGPYCLIGQNVTIGDDTTIMSHVVIDGNTKIGENNIIYPFACIGTNPQDLKFKGEKTNIIIGKNNIIREYVTIHPGTELGGGITRIGDQNLFMISSHIAHDCLIGNSVIIANNVPVAGHCHIEDNVVIGGNSAIQQYVSVGTGAIVGGMTGVNRSVLPYTLCIGNRCFYKNLNLIGLKRKGYTNKIINEYKEFVEMFFKNRSEVKKIEKTKNPLINDFIIFLKRNNNKKICTPEIE